MGFASLNGRARTRIRSPESQARCDRCGFIYSHSDLTFQYEWAGSSMYNTMMLVCRRTCLDVPQPQRMSIVIPADPLPTLNPRPENYLAAETDYRVTSGQNTVDARTGIPIPGGNTRITQDDNNRVAMQTGEPPGGLNELPGTDPKVPDSVGGDDPGLPYDNLDVPTTGPLT